MSTAQLKASAVSEVLPSLPAAAAGIEKIPTTVYTSSSIASKAVAAEIAELIRGKAARVRMPCWAWRPDQRPPVSTPN